VTEISVAQTKQDSGEVLEGGAEVVWNGDLKSGAGSLRLQLGAGGRLPLRWPGSPDFGPGATSPEELAAAAHAACFTMTLAHTLARQGHPPSQIIAEARATFGTTEGVRLIRRSRLNVTVAAEGVSELDLGPAAELAGRYCPVSNTLRVAGAQLDVEVRLAVQ
jgi:lipoyl-dependent peroxiredoxin